MRALALNVARKKLDLVEVEEPQIQGADEVKLKVLKVGICGTDREMVQSDHVVSPEGKDSIVLGHEMLGRVVEVGSLVTHVAPGDLAIFTVRRGCLQCQTCDKGSADMCYTGKYLERGIHRLDGFQSEYVIDREKYLIKVPEDLLSCGVLCEPMSVVQKAIEHVMEIQKKRLPNWEEEENCFEGRHVLLAGLGSIGLLAAVSFLLRGAHVWGYDIVDSDSLRPQILKKMGGNYICAKEVEPHDIPSHVDHLEVIFEAVGNTKLCFDLISALGSNGAYVVTGITERGKNIELDGGSAINQLVMKNQVILGSVNANHRHWEMGIKDLSAAKRRWGDLIDSFITREYAVSEYEIPFFTRDQNEIKSAIEWSKL